MPKILFQSMDTQVVYGRSNLLEVEVSNDRSSLSYQWYKDCHKLSDGDNYENTKSSILLVRHRNMVVNILKESMSVRWRVELDLM